MGAAPLLLALAVVTADAGWENDGRGGYRYVIQVPMEQWETVRTEGTITSQIPANLQGRISSVEIRIGDGPIPKAVITDPRTSSYYPAPPDEITMARAQDSGGFQIPTLDSARQQGGQVIDDVTNAAAEKFREIQQRTGDQFGDAASRAVDDTINSVRNSIDPGFQSSGAPGTSSAGPSTRSPTSAPALQPPASAQPPASTFTAQSGGPSTSPNTGGSNFPSPFNATGGTPRTSPGNSSTRPTATSTGFPAVDAANTAAASTWQPPPGSQPTNPATNPTRQSPQPNAPTPQYDKDQFSTNGSLLDPPSIGRGNAEFEPDIVRLEKMQDTFQYQNDYLVIDEQVLYVLGLERQLSIDKEGRLLDRVTGMALRELDKRYIAVVRFRDAYSELYQQQQAELYRNQIASNQYTNNPRLASLPASGFGAAANTSPTYTNTGSGRILYDDRPPLTAKEKLELEYKLLKDEADTSELQLRIAQLRANQASQASIDGSTIVNSGTPNRPGTTSANGGQTGLKGDGSPSDKQDDNEDSKPGKTTKKAESPPFFNFLLLISVIANIYMGMQISRLLQRYRNLVASQRGTQLVT